MPDKYLFILTVIVLLATTNANPEYSITKCHKHDARCILQSAIDFAPTFLPGIPEWGIQSIDPAYFEKIDCSIPNLKLILKNIKMTGARIGTIKKVLFDQDSKLVLEFDTTVHIDGEYEMNGNLLFLPVEGQGDLNVKIGNLSYHLDLDVEEVKAKDSKKHWRLKSWNSTFHSSGDTRVHFGNLFKGNKVLSAAVDQLTATSSNEIVEEVGGGALNSMSELIAKSINMLFKHMPVEELSLQ